MLQLLQPILGVNPFIGGVFALLFNEQKCFYGGPNCILATISGQEILISKLSSPAT
jgi:hypothetical protein